ncbi:hypothetical protein BGW36DRAFT_395472 [Talaromyces proteolyticus]|uniref:Myb-like domain-containing protein n=1 Tax=Talaromyces proteolyticus TaxID=1131652 RepID=A0AAD4KUQ7_9EURO|nr:uncharacterized protein BGW36DRAFT_395472 [Talaromyces proteolyticus]KAH8700359.1 hypothetical protein BGW36DRAFT_395472 [Talaromyces proteolyticus]
MDPIDPRWGGVQSSSYNIGVSHSYTSAAHNPVVLTPISLADSAYLHPRPSPVLSHHSQEYSYHPVDDSAVHHGLGITSAYHELVPPTSSPNFAYQHPQHHHQGSLDFGDYGSEQGLDSPPQHRAKRQRRPTTGCTPPLRQSPVRILPHPDGLQRLEQERRHGQVIDSPHQREPQRPRPSGRGRRDPQAEEEDAFVENLRAQNLSWKIVAEMFRERFNKNSTEARLQMRMLRRRKSAAAWQEADVALLQEAHNYWQTQKYSIIAAKLQELGASRKYSDHQIEAQLQLLPYTASDDESAVSSPEQEFRSTQRIGSPVKKRRRSPSDE